MKKRLCFLAWFISSLTFASPKPPQLILQLVIDQLRGDLIYRYQAKFGPKGFNYLLAHGINYQNAHHPHANTVTCVGHATIATGAYPAFHGIINNEWYDKKTQKIINCVEDVNSPILTTLRSKQSQPGRSPLNLIASTVSDEIILAQVGRAFAVSFKDRGAITLAGHTGKAFWFDKKNGGFITSQHYYLSYPQWVENWNKHYEAKEETWNLQDSLSNYRYVKAPRFTNRFKEFGTSFPHHLGNPTSEIYYKLLAMTPRADELTADFSIQLLLQEKLGSQAGKSDYLAISFSAVDAIGHQFGPNSLESEDNLLRLDKTLAQLLAAIDKQVGLENTLIILTADHGISDSPIYLTSKGMKKNANLKIDVLQHSIEQLLSERFRLPANTVEAISLPYVYLNHQVIQKKQLLVSQVRHYLANRLSQYSGIFQAYPLPLKNREHNWLTTKVNTMNFPTRVGDIYLVSSPFQAFKDYNEDRVSHGSPWLYDSYVPLLFVNPKFKAQRIFTPVGTTAIAPTVATLLSIKPPSAAIDRPLSAVLRAFPPQPDPEQPPRQLER